jgi:ribosome biogenesis protein BRX1
MTYGSTDSYFLWQKESNIIFLYSPYLQIWVRNYQIVEEYASDAKEARVEKKLYGKSVSTSLVEIGPRFVLNPIKIFRGSFGGQTVYQNELFVSPNAMRSADKKDKGHLYKERKMQQKKRKLREEQIVVPKDPLADVFN